MPLISTLGLVVAGISCLLVARWVVSLITNINRLKSFDGPFSTSFSDLWNCRQIYRGSYNDAYHEACQRYGSIVRVGPNDLITNSPELLMRMSGARNNYTKGRWWYATTRIEPGRDHVFSLIDERAHKERRAVLAAGYTLRGHSDLEMIVDGHLRNLINLIRSNYCSYGSDHKPLDLARKIHFFVEDTITDLGYGKPFGDLTEDKDVHSMLVSTAHALSDMSLGVATGLVRLALVPFIHGLFISEKDTEGLGKVQRLLRETVNERFSDEKAVEKPTIMDSFIKSGLHKDDCVSEVLLSLVAGSDTVATLTRSTLLMVITNPTVYARLQKEVDDTVSKRNMSPDDLIPNVEAQDLPYLQAVIRETIRMIPPASDMATKTTPPSGDTIELDGRKVVLPGNVNISIAIGSMMRRKDIFGEDAEFYRPDRWIEASPERRSHMASTTELIFGYGKYQCLGMKLAKMEPYKAVFELMRNFDFTIMDPTKPWKSISYMGIWVQSDMWVRATDRLSSKTSNL